MPALLANAAKEPIALDLIVGDAGLVGATVRYSVERVKADGTLEGLDFTGMTFKAIAAITTRWRALAPVDAANLPGRYADATGGLDLAAITNPTAFTATAPAIYTVTFSQTVPTARALGADQIVVGVVAATYAFGAPPALTGVALTTDVTAGTAAVNAHTDGATAPILTQTTYLQKRMSNRRRLLADGSGHEQLFADDGVTVEKVVTVKDHLGAPVVPGDGEPSEVTAEADP